MFAKLVKHLVKVRLVLILSVAKYESIVHIHQNEIINVPMHNEIHEMLESAWCISQPKRQHSILKEAIAHYKGSIFTRIWCKSNLVVTIGQVYCSQTH